MMAEYQFKSASNPDVTYTTRVEGSKIICTCPGYTRRGVKECKHTKAVEKQLTGTVTPSLFEDVPMFIEPMLASGNAKKYGISDFDSEWVMEEKFDGHRLVVHVSGNDVTGWARSGLTRLIPKHLTDALVCMGEGTYDGELCIPQATCTDVTALDRAHELVYRVFDILRVKGTSCMHLALADRRVLLEMALSKQTEGSPVQLAAQWAPTDVKLQAIWNAGGEGVIIKNLLAPYVPAVRTKSWIKFKRRQYAVLTLVGFEVGRLGPHSRLILQDADGNRVNVKALNDKWRAEFAKRASTLIGARVSIDYTMRTDSGAYQQPHADHFPDGEVR